MKTRQRHMAGVYGSLNASGGRSLRSAVVLLAVVCLAGVSAFAAEPVDIVQSWGGADVAGWTNTSLKATLDNPADYLRDTFPAESKPSGEEDDIFTNLLQGVYLTNISLRYKAFDDAPSSLQLSIRSSESGRRWWKWLDPSTTGVWVQIDEEVTFGNGWVNPPFGSEAQLTNDLSSINEVAVFLIRSDHGTAPQVYGLDSFRLRGWAIDTDGDEMPDMWENKHGLNRTNAADKWTDVDGDDQANYEEFRGGVIPTDSNSVFDLSIRLTNNVGGDAYSVLNWASTTNRTYSVWRTPQSTNDYVRIAFGIPYSLPRNYYPDVTGTNGPYFYKVHVEDGP